MLLTSNIWLVLFLLCYSFIRLVLPLRERKNFGKKTCNCIILTKFEHTKYSFENPTLWFILKISQVLASIILWNTVYSYKEKTIKTTEYHNTSNYLEAYKLMYKLSYLYLWPFCYHNARWRQRLPLTNVIFFSELEYTLPTQTIS